MSRLIQMVVIAAVGVLVFASLLIPVVSDSTATTKTYRNVGMPFSLADPSDTEPHIIVVDETGLTTDGALVDSSILPGDYTIVFGEHSIIRYTPANGRVVFGGSNGPDTSSVFTDIRTANSEDTLTITIIGDSLTAVNGETSREVVDNWAFVSTKGVYVYAINPCVTSTDRIIGGGVTYSPFSSATVICFDGTIDNITAQVARSNPTVTLNSVDVETSTVNGDLVRIDAIYFNATQSDTDKTATYTYFLAPATIVYDNPAYVGDTLADLLGVIPLVVILGLIMGLIGYAVYTRIE